MKTIGLIGAASWLETAAYLEAIQRAFAGRLGRGHTPKVLLQTFDSAHIALLISQGKWPMLASKLAGAARNLQDAGAGCVALCGLGIHAAAGEIETAVHVPFLHALQAVADEVERLGLRKVGFSSGGSAYEESSLRADLGRRLGDRVLAPAGYAGVEAVIVDLAHPGAMPHTAAPGITILDSLPLHTRSIVESILEGDG